MRTRAPGLSALASRSSRGPGLSALALLLALSAGCATHAAPRSTPSPAVRQLQSDLSQIFRTPLTSRAVWGVEVRSLDRGERLYALDAGKLMMPASNQKIVTLAGTAELLGWDYRFTTTLETSAPIENGVLRGDLLVRSNGDPTINTRQKRSEAVLNEWADALRAAGITSIDGRIIGDDNTFDDEGLGPGWAWDYLEAGYAAPTGALQFNENTATITLAPVLPGDPAIVTVTPGAGYEVVNRVTTGAAGSEFSLNVSRRVDRAVLVLTGSIPAGAAPFTRTVAVVNPTVYFAQAVKDGLASRGIAVSGAAADIDDVAAELLAQGAGDRRVLVTTPSPPLTESATVLMKVSQNLYAETFLKAVGAKRGGLGTTGAGRAAVREVLSGWNIPADSYVMSDGSGLSRYNYVSAEMLTSVLEHLYKDPKHRDAFIATLPIAGKDGTISSRMRRTRAEGNAVAKTGSIANVRALSGYVRTRDGEMLAFSILTNDFTISANTVNYIADVAVEVLANFQR